MMSNTSLVIDALRRTNPALYLSIGGNSSYSAALTKRGARVSKYRRYERGDHDSNLTVQQRNLLNIVADDAELNEASANYCSVIVDMMAGRLAVTEINSKNDEDSDWINQTMERNNFQSKQGEWFRGAIRDGESFVLIDPQTAFWSSEPAFDGYSGVVVIYDDMTSLRVWACKVWAVLESSDVSSDAEDLGEEDIVYLVVYQEDRITYWKGGSGSQTVEKVNVEEGALKILEEGNGYVWELGLIPLVRFGNKRDNYTSYGESELRCIIPLQDIVNGTLYDMMMASKLSAFKIYWSKGMEIDKDGIVPGSVINLVLKDSSGNVLTNIDDAAAKFLQAVEVGEFGTTDMSQYTNQLDKLEREISQVSATPVYGVSTSGSMSGDALRQIEVGLMNKVVRFQKENISAIKMLFKITARVQEVFDVRSSFLNKYAQRIIEILGWSEPVNLSGKKNLELNVNWKSAEIVNIANEVTTLSEMRRDNPNLWPDTWYRERIGSLLGMSSQQITEEGDKADTERVSAFDQLVGGRSGTVPVV